MSPWLSVFWLTGVAVLFLYAAGSYWHLYHSVQEAVLLQDRIYQSDRITNPFVFGILHPKIYVPFGMEKQVFEYVIFHEQAHIRRKDYFWKAVGFLLLGIYWFNPLIWYAYRMFCRDMIKKRIVFYLYECSNKRCGLGTDFLILSILEAFPILISAAILSIPLSYICLHAGLNLMKQADTYPIMVELPFLKIIGLYLLWGVIAAVSRLLCSVYILFLDAAGKNHSYNLHWKNMKWIKEGLILCPLCVLCIAIFYGGIEGWYQTEKSDHYKSVNHYVITNDAGNLNFFSEQTSVYRMPLSEHMLTYLSGVSGIEKSAAYTCMDIGISREDTKRQTAPLVVINPLENSHWEQVIGLSGGDWDKFIRGDFCF